jgi:hypothetical protein
MYTGETRRYKGSIRTVPLHKSDYWESERYAIERFIRSIPSNDVSVICYLRRQDYYLESLYNHIVKACRFAGSIEALIPLVASALDYNRNLSLWSKQIGEENLFVNNFEQALKQGILDDFLKLLVGLNNLDDMEYPTTLTNERLTRDILEYKRILNEIEVPIYESELNMYLLWSLSQSMPNESRQLHVYLSLDQRIKLIDQYSVCNEMLTKRFGPTGTHSSFFQPIISEEHVSTYEGFTTDKKEAIALQHMQMKSKMKFVIMGKLLRVLSTLHQKYPKFSKVLSLTRQLGRSIFGSERWWAK